MRAVLAVLVALAVPAVATAETMVASFYWQGTKTASGARFNPNDMTAAHRSLPFGTRLKVCYRGCIVVTVNDRGPFIKGRQLDLSKGAAAAIGMTSEGVAPVSVERL